MYENVDGTSIELSSVSQANELMNYSTTRSVNQRCRILYEFALRDLSVDEQVLILSMFWPMDAYREYDLGRTLCTLDYTEVKKRYAEYYDLLAIVDTWEEAWMQYMLNYHNCYVGNNETLQNFWALVRDENERI